VSNTATQDELVLALEKLLDQERANILAGGLEHFAKFTQMKAAMTERLLNGPAPDPDTLLRVRNKAAKNQRLLGAAVRAIRSVNGRLQAIGGQNKPLNTYTQSGARQQLGSNGNVNFVRRT
jgi:hypothetical protein